MFEVYRWPQLQEVSVRSNEHVLFLTKRELDNAAGVKVGLADIGLFICDRLVVDPKRAARDLPARVRIG